MSVKVLYHNDGKGKFQSHEVGVSSLDNLLDCDGLTGYGANLTEALHEHIDRISKCKELLDKYYNDLINLSVEFVDLFGNDVKEETITNYYSGENFYTPIETILKHLKEEEEK